MTDGQDAFEDRLAALGARTREEFVTDLAERMQARPSGSGRPWLPLLAVAAVAALIVGFQFWKGGGAADNHVDETVAGAAGSGLWRIVNVDAEAGVVLVQECDEFRVVRLRAGDSCAGKTLVSISPQLLVVAAQDGNAKSVSVNDINRDTEAALRAEVLRYQAAMKGGALGERDLARIALMSRGQCEAAVELLESLAQSSSKLSAAAANSLSGEDKMQALTWLIGRAGKSEEEEGRRQAIRLLGKSDSPLALRLLCELSLDASDPLRALAMDALAARADAGALRMLDRVRNESGDADLRARAEAALNAAGESRRDS